MVDTGTVLAWVGIVITALSAGAGTLASIPAGASRRRIWGHIGVTAALGLTALGVAFPIFKVWPFDEPPTRSISIRGEDTGTGCTIRLEGEALVPDGEDAWLLLINNDTGGFYVHGSRGGPVVKGEEGKETAWDYPMQVADRFYENATYTVYGAIVPLRESAQLRALPEGQEISPDEFPDNVLAADQRTLTLDSRVTCAP